MSDSLLKELMKKNEREEALRVANMDVISLHLEKMQFTHRLNLAAQCKLVLFLLENKKTVTYKQYVDMTDKLQIMTYNEKAFNKWKNNNEPIIK